MRTKNCLSLDDATRVIAAAKVEAAKNKWAVTVAVVDDSGILLALERLDTATAQSPDIIRRAHATGGTYYLRKPFDPDELQLVVAPFFVGDSRAPRFVSDGVFPWNPGRRATLAGVRQIGDVVLLRYALSSRFQDD